jgi:hypothetical protein
MFVLIYIIVLTLPIAISVNNILWAHIEAYASTFAACLPTLPPLFKGRSLDSVLGSVRSIFSSSYSRSASFIPSSSGRRGGAETMLATLRTNNNGVLEMGPHAVGTLKPTSSRGTSQDKQSYSPTRNIVQPDLEIKRYK